MSITGKKGVGIPIILLHDAEGGLVTVELKNGFVYRGILDESQDNMNCTLKECIRTDPEGNQVNIDIAFIRGPQINYVIIPDMLEKAPFFNRIKMWRKFKGSAIFGCGVAIPMQGGRGGGRGGGRDGGRGGRGGFDGGRGGRGGPPPFQGGGMYGGPPPMGGGYNGGRGGGPPPFQGGRGPPPPFQPFQPPPQQQQFYPPPQGGGGYGRPY